MNTYRPNHNRKPQLMPKPEEFFVPYKPDIATPESSDQTRQTRIIRQMLWQRTWIISTACALFFAIGFLLGGLVFIVLP